MTLGELKRLAPRTVWPDEARQFTPWLSENLNHLSEALGLDLELVEREVSVGPFSCDLLARDLGSGDFVVNETSSVQRITITWGSC